MKNKEKGSEKFFYFFDSFSTNTSFFSIFVNERKNRFLPILLDSVRSALVMGIIKNKLNLSHCGVYSYLIHLINGKDFRLDSVCLAYSKDLKLPLSNLIIKNNKTKKIDDISNIFILPADSALIAFLSNVPIFVDSDSLPFLTLPIVDEADIKTLIDFIKSGIKSMEDYSMGQKFIKP